MNLIVAYQIRFAFWIISLSRCHLFVKLLIWTNFIINFVIIKMKAEPDIKAQSKLILNRQDKNNEQMVDQSAFQMQL